MQEGATLKVCTDSCLFGAWVASRLPQVSSILDIGTGTGLLALMLAQKQASAQLTALEIDAQSALLAQQNMANSRWSDRIKIENVSLQEFKSTHSFGLIISNPPFFEKQLRSDTKQHNLAKHQDGLTKEELLRHSLGLLSRQGHFYVLFPDVEGKTFQELAKGEGLFLQQEVIVRNKKEGPVFRRMQSYSFERTVESLQTELVIYKAPKIYTEGFITLLKDYYLYL